MTEKKSFLERWFGIGGPKPEPAEPTPPAKKEPPSDTPEREPPGEAPAKKEPPKDRPAKEEPPERQKPLKNVKAKPGSKPKPKSKPKSKPKRSTKPTARPPSGPAAEPGEAAPEERPPGDREKETPEEKAAPSIHRPKTPTPEKPAPASKPAPPPAGPSAEPGEPPPESRPADEREKNKPEPKSFVTAAPKRGWFDQLRHGLARTSSALSDNLAGVLTKRKLDEDTLDRLEEVLIKADLGVAMADRIRTRLATGRYERGLTPDAVREVLADEIAAVLRPVAQPFTVAPGARPHVMLVVGVNGTGKTTTIAKLAHLFARQGRKVMLAAADTFRAAAIDQLKVWGDRVGAEVVAKDVGTDPAGVAYEALERARADGSDVLLIDTAGRLQNKSDLMAELAKIVRVLKKLDAAAPHSVVLVLDATTGQNVLSQVQTFQEIAGVTSLVVTKLDGTARGGILVAIAERFALPINAIGVGEGLGDLEPFDADDFARAIAGTTDENEAAA